MSTKNVKNYDADEGLAGKNMTSTASATEAAGMMYNPPHDREELSSLRDMHRLQATEFAAAQFGENEPAYPHERRTENSGYGAASGGKTERHTDGNGRHEGRSAARETKSGRRSEAASGRESRRAADGHVRECSDERCRSDRHERKEASGTNVHRHRQEGYDVGERHGSCGVNGKTDGYRARNNKED